MKYMEVVTSPGSTDIVLRIRYRDGAALAEIRGGLAFLISTNFAQLERQGGTRSDDYLDGIMDALIHVARTNEIPVILGPL